MKKAFSLFELLLVVILISLVYSLVLDKMNGKKKVNTTSLMNLKSSMLEKNQNLLIIYDKCSKSNLDIDLNLFKDIKVYSLKGEVLEKKEFAPIKIKDKIYNVCFKYEIFPNKSSSSFIAKKDEKYFVFHPYFQKIKKFDNENDAINDFINKEEKDEFKDEI